jgi:hypothetical protein
MIGTLRNLTAPAYASRFLLRLLSQWLTSFQLHTPLSRLHYWTIRAFGGISVLLWLLHVADTDQLVSLASFETPAFILQPHFGAAASISQPYRIELPKQRNSALKCAMLPTESLGWIGFQALKVRLAGRLAGLSRRGADVSRPTKYQNDVDLLDCDLRDVFKTATLPFGIA